MPDDNSKELDWVQLRHDMDSLGPNRETMMERLKRKCKEAPLVPIGCLTTASVLAYGIICFKRGDKKMSQYMMRARVTAQGFTVVVAVVSTMMAAQKLKTKEAEEAGKPLINEPKK
ncbi:hypothetical protein PV325_008667 [Microctonus aethiopoides]|uniref:HIG1 domain-containing protein n=1 Tax=Microctonus aethiopoides TaxID=144406 RepID=A0AA39EU54_9HYME|nr:hypothetical protein PV325_008667 [Microctonus aethiopoides]KAK0157772.1 hypothetical protein PV328_011470 [Microctonus aethiopoides]